MKSHRRNLTAVKFAATEFLCAPLYTGSKLDKRFTQSHIEVTQMIRDKRLLALFTGIIGSILGIGILLIVMNSPIWAINIGLIIGFLAGAGIYGFKDRQERRSIRQTVDEMT
jgi:hypothetical protein